MKSTSLNMKPSNLKSLLTKSLLATTLLASCLTLFSPAKPASADNTYITTTQTGYDGGKFFSFYRSGSSYADGTNLTMTLYGDLYGGGSYSVDWSGLYGDFTCGKGWYPGTYYRTMGYNCGYYQNDNGGSLGAYGWTQSPDLCEYYVDEIYGGNPPKGDDYIGTIYVDGDTYDNYHTYTFGPTIEGDKNFDQYVSNRRDQASQGENHSIDMASHFDAWQNWANPFGKNVPTPNAPFDYQILLTEGYSGNGQPASGSVSATVW